VFEGVEGEKEKWKGERGKSITLWVFYPEMEIGR
jgi:hypothetical protein